MHETGLTLRVQDLIDNPVPRVPVSLVLDCSGSMTGDPIEELRVGVEKFIKEVADNEYAKDSAEICVVTFGGRLMRMTGARSLAGIAEHSLSTHWYPLKAWDGTSLLT